MKKIAMFLLLIGLLLTISTGCKKKFAMNRAFDSIASNGYIMAKSPQACMDAEKPEPRSHMMFGSETMSQKKTLLAHDVSKTSDFDESARDINKNEDPKPKDPQTNKKIKRQIIYTARYTVHVKNIEKAIIQLNILLDTNQGHVGNETNSNFVVRIPAANFEGFVNAIENLGKIIDKYKNAQDVTEQYYDLSLRIKVLEKRLIDYENLRAEAKTVREKLEVDKEITKIVMELDSLKGRLRFLSGQVAFSTVTIYFTTDPTQMKQKPQRRYNRPFRWVTNMRIENLLGDTYYPEEDE